MFTKFSHSQIQIILLSIQTVSMNLSQFAWLLLILERTVASVFVGFYEARFSGIMAQIATFVAVVSVVFIENFLNLLNLLTLEK